MWPYLAVLLGGAALGFAVSFVLSFLREKGAGRRAREIVEQAEREASNIKKEAELRAREELFQRRQEVDRELNAQRRELQERERRLQKLEESLTQKLDLIDKKERTLESSQRRLNERLAETERRQQELDELIRREFTELQRISGLRQEEARQMLLERVERELSAEIGERILKHEEHLRQVCEEKARDIIASAIQRYAAPHTTESTTATVDIPSDDMKGRIIGREGRNIRAFERATGVEVIVDDTPGVVTLSAFDSIRREVARLAMQKLIQNGRIHPTRIEEVVEETQRELEEHIKRIGREAAQEAGVSALHERLIELLGRLKFRTSYSQNVLRHSIEVAYLAGVMAGELGADPALARRCGLLHDIGKASDHEMEGGHAKIGAELARRYREPPEVVHAIAHHHDEGIMSDIYTVLVASADAISAARPGARRETLEKYIKRMEELESLASGFPGVQQAYAIQAGREVRVIADARKTTDKQAAKVCRDIARAIERQLTYPGEIKVTVVREMRVVEYAR